MAACRWIRSRRRLIAENIAICGSFSVSFSAHAGIGTLPLVWYGTAEQKEKYLPRLAAGEWIAAYALSEAFVGFGCDEYSHSRDLV